MSNNDLIWRLVLLGLLIAGIAYSISEGIIHAKEIIDYIKLIGIRITEFNLW